MSADSGADPGRAICPLFGTCGGCSTLDVPFAQSAAAKAAALTEALRTAGLEPPIGDIRRAPFRSRRRITLTKSGSTVGLSRSRSHEIVDVPQCPALDPALDAALPAVRDVLAALPAAKARATLTLADNGIDVAVDQPPEPRARRTDRRGRGRRRMAAPKPAPRPPLPADPAILRLTLDGETLWTREPPTVSFDGVAVPFPPGAFLQPSRVGEALLQAFVTQALEPERPRRVADLFCGLGTFALPITRFAAVHAMDSAGDALDALAAAASHTQGRAPLTVERQNLVHHPPAPERLATFDAVVFDPPRAGAEALCRALAAADVDHVVAVSCAPATFARDLAILAQGGFKITQVTPVDQFAGTDHIEALANLRRTA